MRLYSILTLIFLPYGYLLFGCECVEYARLPDIDINSYYNSDVVMVANIISAGNEYRFIVHDLFKGSIDNDTLNGSALNQYGHLMDNCVFYPKNNGLYLLYLFKDTLNGQLLYRLSQCQSNRALDMSDYTYVKPDSISKEEILIKTRSWLEYLKSIK